MNKHFSDARYYLGRAATHLKIGLGEELEPASRRVRARFGWEVDEPAEPQSRAGRVRVAAERSTARIKRAASQRIAKTGDEQTA